MSSGSLCAKEAALQIRVDDLVPVRFANVEERCKRLNSCIVDGIEFGLLTEDLIELLLNVFTVPDIGLDLQTRQLRAL